MEQTLEKLYTFIQNLKEYSYVLTSDMESDPENYRKSKTVSVRLDELHTDSLEKFMKIKDNSFQDPSMEHFVDFTEQLCKIRLNDEEKWIKYLRINLTWTREEQNEKEGIIKGGGYFNGIMDVFSSKPTTFSELSLNKFLEYEDASKTDVELIRKLRFIESPTSLQNAFYTPYFGCVTLNGNEFPTEFYFYDSGLVYKLPFKSYEEYIDALIQSAAVYCWQYFYIDPQEIIAKNKGISYYTWGLHTRTALDEELAGLHFVPNAKYDRLDLINDYLKNVVKLLPNSFPFLNFEHHINYYEQFKKLYNLNND